MTLLHHWLSANARSTADATAVIEPKAAITYGQLDRLANRVANALLAAGVGRGDRVVLALDNSIPFIAAYFGILKAGAVVVPLPPGAKSDRLQPALAGCEPAACIVDGATFDAIDKATSFQGMRVATVLDHPGPSRASAPAVASLTAILEGEVSDSEPLVQTSEMDLAAIIYTSGSTGAPRGVMLSHLNFVSNARSIVQYLELTRADRAMVVLPFYYVYGLSLLHTHVAVGGSLVLDNRFAFPNVVLRAIEEHAATGFAGVPSTFAMLLHRSNLAESDLSSLRYVTQAGGPMPPALLQKWLEIVPDVPFFVMYGATEAAARLSYLQPSELRRRLGSIGRAIPGVELRVLTDDGREASAGEAGEIVARGPNISSGYWNCPEETCERFGPDGFRTGDLGYADTDGYLYVVGRRHDMIKVGAHRVAAKEIEDVLHEHPAIHEAAVVGELHPLLGESPVAHIAVRDGVRLDSAEVIASCRARLPEHKVPTRVVFHAELPKTFSGKIAKDALRRGPVSSISPGGL